jgi:hypothetical protein
MVPLKQWRFIVGLVIFFGFCFSSVFLEGSYGQAFRDTSATGDVPATDVLKRPQDSLILGVNVDTVSILVTARNKKGDYISNLIANDFLVLEDGEEQPLSYFKQDTVPVNVVFLVDASYSVNEVLPKIIDAPFRGSPQNRRQVFGGHLCPQADQSPGLDR